ncbi:rhodanese-like domain-containing protein [Porticoccaceae bacterium]|nr:rhodanese-like domain-containing protein [Porticoccaceae bacterium]MDC0003048.1 rhodanese-like domain-containing protein [Porticoccaceae bacterium]
MDIFLFASEQWILISVLLMLIYVFAFTERTKGGKPITVSEAVSLMNSDQAVLVDVRPSNEFQAGHIHGAMNIPHTKLTGRISELEKCRSKIVLLADQMGQHAGGAGRALTKEGYNVRRLSGGMTEWQGQKMPMVQGLKD